MPQQKKQRPIEVPDGLPVILMHDEELSSAIRLPFVPQPGIHLRDPHANHDYREVGHVCWNDETNCFEVFFK